MLSLSALTLTLFKILLASYFISHGLNLSHNIDSTLPLLNSQIKSILGLTLPICSQYLTVYSHLEVVVGIVMLMGWRTGRILGLIMYVLNSTLLATSA